jgi:hypothetical protein
MDVLHWVSIAMVAAFVGGWVFVCRSVRGNLTRVRRDSGENAGRGEWLDAEFAKIEEDRKA